MSVSLKESSAKTDQVIGILFSIDGDRSGPLRAARGFADSVRTDRGDDDAVIAALTGSHVALVKARSSSSPSPLPPNIGLPVEIRSTLVIQAHLIACIARVKGHDLHSEKLRDAIRVCLLVNASAEILTPIGTKIGLDLLNELPTSVIDSLAKELPSGGRLLWKVTPKRAISTLTKMPPAQNFLSQRLDVGLTKLIGKHIQQLF